MLNQTDDEQHPVLLDDYAIYTPSIEQFFNQIYEWLESMVPGAFIYGRPRLGKTRSIRYWLNELLSEKYGEAACLYKMQFKYFQNCTEQNFLDELILAVKGVSVSMIKSRSKALKYELAANHIITDVKEKQAHKVLFVIDEAQNIPSDGYRWLCNFQNMLDENGLRLTFVLVGSYELSYQQEVFKSSKDTQIIGRFMLHKAKFRGVLIREELEYILDGYDADSEWPRGSQKSFTRFFFTEAFDHGFRLKNHTEEFWEAYLEEFSGIEENFEIPMEHIGKAINYIFRKYGTTSDSSFFLERHIILEAIEHTQYSNYTETMYR